jgi:hypothetical protein
MQVPHHRKRFADRIAISRYEKKGINTWASEPRTRSMQLTGSSLTNIAVLISQSGDIA